MSELTVWIIPRDRHHVPSKVAAEKAKSFLLQHLDGTVDSIFVSFYDRLTHVVGYASCQVKCSICKTTIDRWGDDRARSWWETLHETLCAGNVDLSAHQVEMPCCGTTVPVLSLDFAGTAAFSKFVIQLHDTAPLDDQELMEVENILNCPLEAIETWET